MTGRRSFRMLSGLILMLLSAAPAFARQPPRESPRADVFVGLGVFYEDDQRFDSLQVTGSYRPWRYVSLIGDFARYGGGRNTLMGGVRVQSTGRIAPFAQVLYGSAPLDDLAIQPGAGVDFRFARQLAVRAAVDFKFSGDDGNTYTGARVSAGLVLRFGPR